jgi:hypothetical protein
MRKQERRHSPAGRKHRLLLPVAAGAGAVLLVLADALPRRRAGAHSITTGPAMPRAELVALQPDTANAALSVRRRGEAQWAPFTLPRPEGSRQGTNG